MFKIVPPLSFYIWIVGVIAYALGTTMFNMHGFLAWMVGTFAMGLMGFRAHREGRLSERRK